MNSLISVIIPAYNAEKCVARCLDSVYSQSYPNLQVIVVNDGSTDSTKNVLHEFKTKHNDLIVIEQPNGGASKARNSGIDAATSEFIAFIDADDTIDSNYFEELLHAIQINNADIVVCGCRNIDSKTGRLLFTDSPMNHKIKLDNNFIVFWGAPWGKLYRSALIKGKCYFAEGALLEDDPYSMMVHSLAGKVIPLNYIGYNYYVNDPSSKMELRAKDGTWLEVFPYSAYEAAIKSVIQLGDRESFTRLQIYYFRMFFSLLYHWCRQMDKSKLVSFHYTVCKNYSLTKKIIMRMPFFDRLKINLMIYATKFHLL